MRSIQGSRPRFGHSIPTHRATRRRIGLGHEFALRFSRSEALQANTGQQPLQLGCIRIHEQSDNGKDNEPNNQVLIKHCSDEKHENCYGVSGESEGLSSASDRSYSLKRDSLSSSSPYFA